MQALHELVSTVVTHVTPVFEAESLPPNALVDLRQLWIDNMEAAGMFDTDPSPFPTAQALPRTATRRATRKVNKNAKPLLVMEEVATLASDDAQAADNDAAATNEYSDFGRPQTARPRPAPPQKDSPYTLLARSDR